MKKIALLFSLLFFVFVCNAQIQTKILGAEIGVTTKGEIIEILKKENISFKEDGSGVTVSNVPFSQITWANGGFMLDNDKVIAVMLYDNEKGQKPSLFIMVTRFHGSHGSTVIL